MTQDDVDPSSSAFCDQIIGKFLGELRSIDGLSKVADQLEVELITNNSTKEDALRKALFETSPS